MDYLERHDIGISIRTFQRDLQTMRSDLGIEIKYQEGKNYYIDWEETDLRDLESFTHFLEIVHTANIFGNTMSKERDLLSYISFDSSGNFSGANNLKGILKAIKEQKLITFNHLNYLKNEKTNFTVKPYGLREYKNRWYLAAVADYRPNEITTFGLDRIEDLGVSQEIFKKDPKIDPVAYYKDVVGVLVPEGDTEKIVLSFLPWRGKFVKSLKLHRSQQILVDDDNECRIQLKLKVNNELEDLILSFGESVKVIEPMGLVKKIQDRLNQALSQYN